MARIAYANGRYCRLEAWFVDAQDRVLEGTSSNAYLVDRVDRLITHPLGERIPAGITRSAVLELAAGEGIEVVEQPFTTAEPKDAAETALSSTSSWAAARGLGRRPARTGAAPPAGAV